MSIKRLFPALTLTAACMALAACSPKEMWEGAAKAAMVMWDPELPVGPPDDQPSIVTISLYAEPDVNVTDFGQAPVEAWVFQLSNEDELMMTDFATLAKDQEDALGRSFVDMKTKQVKPGSSTVIRDWKLDEDTTLIGVAVAYAAIENQPEVTEPENATRHQMTLEDYRLMVALGKEGLVENADWQRVEKISLEGEDYNVYRPVPPGSVDAPLIWRAFERVNATGETYHIVIPIRAKSVSVQVHR